ncbi:MAG: tyrosine-type recombinase/integrase [Gemmataceae bacterium]
MTKALARTSQASLARFGFDRLPRVIAKAGERACRRFVEFFTANIRNKNTRLAYAQAVGRFLTWCEKRRFELDLIEPVVVAAYVEELTGCYEPPTVKQHLAAIRMLFDWLVVGQVVPMNPASSVRGPKHVVKKGKTPVLSAKEARELLDSIDTSDVAGLRDRALIGLMVYSFARVSAAVGMDGEDYLQRGKRTWFRLREKGGKHHEVPGHHNAVEYVDAYLAAAPAEKKGPLFRTIDRDGTLTDRRMTRNDVLRMIKRRALNAGLPAEICCHTFRATGITAYLENGGTIENAQAIAAHESPRTTKLYDRTGDEITLDEVERILI